MAMPQAAPATALPTRTRVPTFTRLAYGFGSVVDGVRNGGFNYLLLIFYSQVIGLDARLVGLAITVGLIADAVLDTGIGYVSDNLRTRWGRRHPLMYAAALPVGLGYFLIWDPPVGWSQMGLFWYLLSLTLGVRFCSSLFEVPNAALTAELTEDYVERSALASLRFYFGWTAGALMTVLVFGAIFPAFVTASVPNGQFNRDAYAFYGLVASALMFAAILVATARTHNQIPYLKPAPTKRRLTPRLVLTEIRETLANRAFFALFMVSAFGLVASGVSTALYFYLNSYFWGFTTQQMALLSSSVLISAVIGALLAPLASRTIGKRRGALVIGLTAFLGAPLPIVLRLIGLLPPELGDTAFHVVLGVTIVDLGLIIAFQILSASMLADLVEQAEVATGRRSEGLFAASTALLGKLVQGLGVTIASFVLTAAGIKAGAAPGEVSAEAIWRPGALYVPTVLSLWMAMLGALTFYKLNRSDHEDNLRALAERRAAAG